MHIHCNNNDTDDQNNNDKLEPNRTMKDPNARS